MQKQKLFDTVYKKLQKIQKFYIKKNIAI